MSNYRNRKLLDLAHRVTECQLCGCATTDGCEPAHANWSEYGKGMSIKAHDWAHAAICRDCHYMLDQGKELSKQQRRDMWDDAYRATSLTYWRNGWLEVK